MKKLVYFLVFIITFSGSAMGQEDRQVIDSDSDVLCALVSSSESAECKKLAKFNRFEVIPVELCEFRIGSNEMLDCFKAIKNKTFDYSEVLECAKTQRLGIIECLNESGTSTLD